jgi:hypothetical protein
VHILKFWKKGHRPDIGIFFEKKKINFTTADKSI